MPGDELLFRELQAARYGNGRRRQRLILPKKLAQAGGDLRLAGAARDKAYAILVKWAELESNGRLAKMSETQLQAEFLTEVFGQALGYTLFSAGLPEWNLWPQFPVNGGTADGAIGVFAPDATNAPRAVIELKGPTVDLDRDRSNGRTPVRQCWDYLNELPACPWGIVCNYVSFRLYHRDKTPRACELFTLQDLRREATFREFYALFQRGGLLREHGSEPRADRLLRETGERQREVGDEFYEQYSAERLELIAHLHAQQNKSVDAAIHIAQRLIDRVVFIAFCQSRELIKAKTLDRTFHNVPLYQKVTNPRWRNFLSLFHAVDVGHADLDIEQGYNGNLFKPDPEIDNLQLDDSWTNFFRHVGEYDFRDEINVDVLGHLFEKSVTELEKLRAGGFFGAQAAEPGPGAMPKSAQRKRFGIYYTPPEFTDFLVRQTVGAVIADRYAALAAQHGVADLLTAPPATAASAPRGRRGTPESTPGPLLAYYRACLATLRDIKIVDPACGSGAFLIRAYDFLDDHYQELFDHLEGLGEKDAHKLRDGVPDMILRENLFGVDLSPEAVEITQLALWIRSARIGRTLADLSRNIVCGNSLIDDPAVDPAAFQWAERFPAVFGRDEAGFDCVIGNPPWERLKVQEREFFALAAPEIAAAVSAAQRRTMVAKLEASNPALFARYEEAKAKADRALTYARESGRFPLTGKGDINTYMLFAELARGLVAPHGRVGLLVPSGIATDDTTKEFFGELMSSRRLVLLYDFENKRPYFEDVHRSFKFCTLVYGGGACQREAADFVFFARELEEVDEKKRHVPLDADDLALLNPNTRTCPIFRSRRDADLTKAIYRRVPILIDESRQEGGNPWGIRFLRMFDQTNDAELFHTREQLTKLGCKPDGNRWRKRNQVFLPLYEAKMVQAYDHRAASVVVEEGNWVRQGQTKETSLVQHQNPEFLAEPRWWVEKSKVDAAFGDDSRPAYLAYKDVTSPTNERTMIAAFLPHVAVVNSAPLILIDAPIEIRRRCCLLANLNSFALDFVARQKVGGIHLNFFIVEQLPLLPPDAYAEHCPWHGRQTLERWISDRVLKLTCTANDMLPLAEAAGFDAGVHKWKPDERARLRAELDAAYFILYGISRDDAEYILSTFTGTERRDAAETGGFRTAELILTEYDRLRG